METKKAKIPYPCEWCYKIIGEDRSKMLKAVDSLIKTDSLIIRESHTSKNGKYISLEIRVIVQNETERNDFFQLLARHSDIRLVI